MILRSTEEICNNTKLTNSMMTRYFYIDSEGKQRGPLTLDELRIERIKKENLVWTQGMPEWKRAYEVMELKPLFEVSATSIHNQHSTTPPPYEQAQTDNLPMLPKTWMVESILVTILPFILCGNVLSLIGIAAIVNASKVESLYKSGLYDRAKEASDNAGRWTKITLWVVIGAIILTIVAIIAFVMFFGSLEELGSNFV